jgi:lysophospholipase L1-like esterase
MPRQSTVGFSSFLSKIAPGFLALISAFTMSTAFSADAVPAAQRNLVLIGASYVHDWGQPQLPGYRITNHGIGGEQSSQVRARFERDVVAARPDAVLIWGHINDIFRSPRDQIEQAKQRVHDNYQAMHQQAQAAGIEVMLATEVTLTVGDTWKDQIMAFLGRIRGKEDYRVMINRHVKDVNDWLRKYAAQHGLKVLEFERTFDNGNGSRRAEYTQPDGSHISPAGYQVLTAYTKKALATAR